MLDLIFQAFSIIIQPGSLLAMLLGLVIGLVVGVTPGIGGPFAVAILMPLAYGMDPVFGIVFLITLASVVGNGGSITAILIGVPGTPTNAATLFDGYQMAKNGEAGRAIGAALTASAVGGIFGALVLIAIMPVMRSVILTFGHPELFMIAVLGISFVAVLGKGSMRKAFLSAVLGFVVSLVGYDPISGVPRYDMGLIHLYDGIKILPITLGLFALPEIVGLYVGAGSTDKRETVLGGGILEGVKDVFRYWFLVMRCSVIGSLIGTIPGLGGDTATFLAYGHAKQTSRRGDRFGQGEVAGVIAPESANNAKEGGALVPTLGFGIPGSVMMAILVSAFIVLGLQPGPLMMKEQPELILVMALLTGITNVFGSLVCLLAAKWLIKIASIRVGLMVPWILALIMMGSYIPRNSYTDVIITILVGILGMAMKFYGYSRVALLLAVVLSRTLELNFWMGLQYFGWSMFLRPAVLILIGIIILTIGSNYLMNVKKEVEST